MRAVQYRQKARSVAAIWARAIGPCLVAASLFFSPVRADDSTAQAPSHFASASPDAAAAPSRRADFHGEAAPYAVKKMANWVADSQNNKKLPFVILDKPEAKVFVFDKDGYLKGAAWALVGLSPGDDSVPGIGTMPLTAIHPDMRTTPAGRFVAALGHDLGKVDVLWVDYPDAISLHRVINVPNERRLERIISPAPIDHRISYGCINVPAKFFDTVVDPTFQGTNGIVYILPEVKATREVFPDYYDVKDDPAPLPADLPVLATQ